MLLLYPVVISTSFQPHYGSIAIKGKVIGECVLPRNRVSHLHFRAKGDGSCAANKGSAGADIMCLDMQFASWSLQHDGHRYAEARFGSALCWLPSHRNSEYLHGQCFSTQNLNWFRHAALCCIWLSYYRTNWLKRMNCPTGILAATITDKHVSKSDQN
jgi:hypothetical protein